jgi:hypothetical protein
LTLGASTQRPTSGVMQAGAEDAGRQKARKSDDQPRYSR